MAAAMRIVLEVDSSLPLQGRVVADGAAARPFAGWLGLMELLRQLLDATHTEESEPKKVEE
jgi:hypothetical protein